METNYKCDDATGFTSEGVADWGSSDDERINLYNRIKGAAELSSVLHKEGKLSLHQYQYIVGQLNQSAEALMVFISEKEVK